MPDGSIVFNTRIDTNGMDAGMQKIKVKTQKAADDVKRQLNTVSNLESELTKWQSVAANQQTSLGFVGEPVQANIEQTTAKLETARVKLDGLKIKAEEAEIKLGQAMNPVVPKLFERNTNNVSKSMSKFNNMLSRTLLRAAIFSLVAKSIMKIREQVLLALRTNQDYVKAVGQLKGSLITLVQPISQLLAPALTMLANILTVVANGFTKFFAIISGSSLLASKDAAKASQDINRSLASFDEIDKLSGKDDSILPDFDTDTTDKTWLETTLGKVAGWVTAATLLGGIGIVAIGACTGNIKAILAGFTLIAAGVSFGEETGVLNNWLEIALGQASGWVSAALLLGGIALVAIGACAGNILAIIAGLGMIAAGVYVATESGTLKSWIETLMLPQVAQWVTVALLLGGIALIVFGIVTANIVMLIGGIIMLTAGVGYGIQSGTLRNWWEVLMLPQVAGWITTALLLAGIALIVIGIITANIPMIIAGMVALAAGIGFGLESGTFKNWWDVLMLPQVAQWVTAALTLGGIALVAIGVMLVNIPMLLAGLALFGIGITEGAESGTLANWWDTLKLPQVAGWITVALELGGIAMIAIGAATGNIALVLMGIVMLGGGALIGSSLSSALSSSGSFNLGGSSDFDVSGIGNIPQLATGGVLPANSPFLAVLGDQKSGNNIEAPESLIRSIVSDEISKIDMSPVVNVSFPGSMAQLGRVLAPVVTIERNRVGPSAIEEFN